MGLAGRGLRMLSSSNALTPEMLVPRIGDYLVNRGFITIEDLVDALATQRELEQTKKPQLIGQILVSAGKIDQSILDQAITEHIIDLKDALETSNKRLESRVAERTTELEAALKKINELNELKSNFISNISHELRTPLTHLKGYLNLFASGDLGPITKDQNKALNVMNRAYIRLEKLIDDLLMFTFAEYEEVNITKSKFNMIALVAEIISTYKNSTPKRTIYLRILPEETSLWVNADQKKIAWVITHLIDNAIKFSDPNTRITVFLQHNAEIVKTTVSDQGSGIDKDQFEQIFEPFHQLDGSSTRKAGGVGLGLALSKKIIEAHTSSLNVRSEVGIGSQFDFSLKRLII